MSNLYGAIWFLMALCVLGITTGCSSQGMVKQTNQDKIDIILERYLPIDTSVQILTQYEVSKKRGSKVDGFTQCNDWDTRVGCKIYAINDPVVVLHEICHRLEGYWHGSESHSGLQGCKSFNYDTLAGL